MVVKSIMLKILSKIAFARKWLRPMCCAWCKNRTPSTWCKSCYMKIWRWKNNEYARAYTNAYRKGWKKMSVDEVLNKIGFKGLKKRRISLRDERGKNQ